MMKPSLYQPSTGLGFVGTLCTEYRRGKNNTERLAVDDDALVLAEVCACGDVVVLVADIAFEFAKVDVFPNVVSWIGASAEVNM